MSLLTDGYGIVQGVFHADFMRRIEEMLPECPRLCIESVMLHPTVLLAARGLIGEELARTGEESVNVNPAKLYENTHYDIPWESKDGGIIPVWRFAVYFRDYRQHSGGLQVHPGSHLGPTSAPVKLPVPVLSARGDLVIWNLRTLHKANAFNAGHPCARPRNAIFFDYGKPGPELERYKAWRATQA